MRSKKTGCLELKDITKEAKDKDGLFQFKLHFLIFLIASTLHYCVFFGNSTPLPPLLCGWGSSQHSVGMPTAGAKFNSNPNISNVYKIETPLRFTQLNFLFLQGNIPFEASVYPGILGYRFDFQCGTDYI